MIIFTTEQKFLTRKIEHNNDFSESEDIIEWWNFQLLYNSNKNVAKNIVLLKSYLMILVLRLAPTVTVCIMNECAIVTIIISKRSDPVVVRVVCMGIHLPKIWWPIFLITSIWINLPNYGKVIINRAYWVTMGYSVLFGLKVPPMNNRKGFIKISTWKYQITIVYLSKILKMGRGGHACVGSSYNCCKQPLTSYIL